MKKVIFIISILVAWLTYGSYKLFVQLMPTTSPTAVIAEKPGKTIGGQAAVLLPASLTKKQNENLNLAYKIAQEEGVNPELVQSIILQETQAGGMKQYRVANEGPEAYFGLGQIKLAAAKDILNANPQLFAKYEFHTRSADEIKAFLILNNDFNLRVTTKYLKLLERQYGFKGRQLMNAYNRGPGGVHGVDDTFHYAIGAEAKLRAYKQRS